MPGPVVPRAHGAISSDRAHWHPAGSGFRGWNSTGRTRVLPPVGALVSPGPDHCLHGIPSGWSHDAPFAVRRPAHRLRHALASRRSRGRCHAWTRLPPAAIQLLLVFSRLAWLGELPSSSARPAPRSSSGAPISQAEPSTAGSPPMIGTTEPSSPAAWPVSVRYPGSPADGAVSGSCPGGGAGSSSDHVDLVGPLAGRSTGPVHGGRAIYAGSVVMPDSARLGAAGIAFPVVMMHCQCRLLARRARDRRRSPLVPGRRPGRSGGRRS